MTALVKTVCTTLVLILVSATALNAGTTNDDIMKDALKYYDEAITKYKKIKGENEKADEGKKVTREQFADIKLTIDKGIDLFDQYLRVGTNDASKKACRHYSLVLKSYIFAIKNDLGEFRDNFGFIKGLDSELSTIKGYYYPLKYSVGSKNYIIETSQRTSIEKTLLVEFVESSTNANKSSETITYAKRAYATYSYGDYNLWWCAHLWYYHANSLRYADESMVEPAEKVIYAMSGLKRSDIKKIKDSNWVNYTHAYYKLNSLLASKPTLSRTGEVWAKAGEAFEKLDEDKWAIEYYNKALKDGYGDRAFLVKMMDKGKDKKDKTLVKTAADIFDSKNLYTTYYCSDYNMMSGYYEYAGESAKAGELKTKFETCQKEQDRKNRRAERGGRFFLSFAPLPLLSHNVQGSIQIGGRKKLHEFGVRQINDQRDGGLDLGFGKKTPDKMIWSGMSYYYTNKTIIKGGSGGDTYLGFQFRYTDKKYDAVSAKVNDANTNAYAGSPTFNPTEKRYDFTFNWGVILVGRYFHFEMYFGAGVGFSKFDGGNDKWNNEGYKISGNQFLSDRKEFRVGFTPRFGFKIGLNLINY